MVAITFRKQKGYSFCVLSRIFLESSGNALFLLETFIESRLYFRHSARETNMNKITSTFLRKAPQSTGDARLINNHDTIVRSLPVTRLAGKNNHGGVLRMGSASMLGFTR